MRQSQWRRGPRFLALLAAAAGLLALAPEAASAHFYGTMVVGGNGGGTVTAPAWGGPETWCSGFPSGTTTATATGGSVSISMAPHPSEASCPKSKLDSGTYPVYLYNGPAFIVTSPGNYQPNQPNCRSTPTAQIGTITINHQGEGNGGPYLLPPLTANVSGEASSVCIWVPFVNKNDRDRGNEAPIIIT